MNKFWTTLIGLGSGAGLMYIVDPQAGRRRRALARDKAASAWNKTGEAVGTFSTDISNRARGIYAEARSKIHSEQVSDQVVEERVKSRLGRYCSHPSAIEATVSGGRVTLRGPILHEEVKDVVSAARSVRGVSSVDNQLEVHADPGNVPSLQGAGKRPGAAFGFMRYNWSPTHRVLATGIGSGLALYGFMNARHPAALVAAAAGLAFAARGITNTEMRQWVPSRGERAREEESRVPSMTTS